MKVTCSILCHNYGRFLRQAIESCLGQELAGCDVEVLVIDDGSTDNTPEVCREFADRIHVVRSERNLGFGASLDRAISEATGEYVCLLDADDYFVPTKLRILLPALERGCLFIQHASQPVDENGKELKIETGIGNTSTICINREAALTLLPVMNEVFFQPIHLAAKSETLTDRLTMYRIHRNSMLQSTPPGTWYQHLADVSTGLAEKLARMSTSPPFWANSNQLIRLASNYRAVAAYNAIESALFDGRYFAALGQVPVLLRWGLVSKEGLSRWHFHVAARALLNRRLRWGTSQLDSCSQ